MQSNDLYMLAENVRLVPVLELGEQARNKFEYDETDYIISYSHSRMTSKIIDAASAALLKEFQAPTSLAEGILKYAILNKLDPTETLADSYSMLCKLRSEGFLCVYENSADKKYQSFQIGDLFKDYTIVQTILNISDTDVFKVQRNEQFYALKILKVSEENPQLLVNFKNEIKILQQLDGKYNPLLIESGEEDGMAYILLEWMEGMPVDLVAAKFRNFSDNRNFSALMDICSNILQAYAHLHNQGIIHGDIHARNILIDESGSIRIIDFGLACKGGEEIDGQRGGLAFFYDPDFARCLLNNEKVPTANYKSEQYSIGTLLYHLITGQHYLAFSFEKQALLSQIIQESPIPFLQYDIEIHPEIEKILLRSLSKDPLDRHESLECWAAKLQQTLKEISLRSVSYHTELQHSQAAFCQSLKIKFGMEGRMIQEGLHVAPTCSVNYGAAGIAYMFYRMACLESDPELLATADIWANKAAAFSAKSDSAFYSADLDLTRSNIGNIALYHTATGVYLVQALISRSMCDVSSFHNSVRNFIREAEQPSENLDLTLGKSGVLVGCSILFRQSFLSENISSELKCLGNEILKSIWDITDQYEAIGVDKKLGYIGVAHGWAGVMYASLLWCSTTGEPLPPGFFHRVDQLIGCGITEKDFIRWNLTPDQLYSWPGWCHGSSGYCFLWTLLFRYTGDIKYLKLAEKSAQHFLSTDVNNTNGSLCCGLSGEAFALLNVFNATGEEKYLLKARSISKQILQHIGDPVNKNNSLYKGDIGIGVLFTEILHPEHAIMPLFE